MKTIVTVKTGKGKFSTFDEVERTEKEVLKIAELLGGTIRNVKNLRDGSKIIVERS